MRKTNKRSSCPISYSLDILGDKWVMLILRDMTFRNKHFYKEFLVAGEGIATNVLSDRLKMLEANDIIKSSPYRLKKSMKYYSLTEKGTELIPLLVELWYWGAKHDPTTEVTQKEIDQRMSMKDELIAKYTQAALEAGQ